jgi:hypothetical protein
MLLCRAGSSPHQGLGDRRLRESVKDTRNNHLPFPLACRDQSNGIRIQALIYVEAYFPIELFTSPSFDGDLSIRQQEWSATKGLLSVSLTKSRKFTRMGPFLNIRRR